MKPTCSTCKFFKRHSAVLKDPGNCHRQPPTMFILAGPQGQPVPQSCFPPVNPQFWCGEHKPALSILADAGGGIDVSGFVDGE